MTVKNLDLFLEEIKDIILSIDKSITDKKVLTSGQYLEKEGSFDKKKFAPYYTIFFDIKNNSSFLTDKNITKGDIVISKVIILNNTTKKPNIYSFIDDTIKLLISKIKDFLASNRIQYSTITVKTITSNDPLITVEVTVKNITLTLEL